MEPPSSGTLRGSQTGNLKRRVADINVHALQIERLPIKILTYAAFHPLNYLSTLKQV